MATIMNAFSTLTSRFQTTVPEAVRKALELGKSDKVCYEITGDGRVILSKAQVQDEDPALYGFLSFLEDEIKHHPAHIHGFSPSSVQKAAELTADVKIDLDAPL